MLPEFPIAQDAITETWNKLFFEALHSSDPLMSQIPLRVQKEGNHAAFGNQEIKYQQTRVEFQWKPEIGKGKPFYEFFELARQLGSDMARKQAKFTFKKMSEPGPHHSFFETTAGAISFDDFLAQMDRIEIEFDAMGIPRLPAAFVGTSLMAEIRQKSVAWNLDETCRRRFNDFLAKKRKEFDEREARRRLVD